MCTVSKIKFCVFSLHASRPLASRFELIVHIKIKHIKQIIVSYSYRIKTFKCNSCEHYNLMFHLRSFYGA